MPAIPKEVLEWQFGLGATHYLNSVPAYVDNKAIWLKDVRNGKYLSWGRQPAGINLVWKNDDSDRKVHFQTKDGAARRILTGEPLSFFVGGGDVCLYYDERTSGINLSWSAKGEKKPEWRIFDASGEPGQTIRGGQSYAILNDNVKPEADFLVYFNRLDPTVCDIGWTSSPKWSVVDVLKKVNEWRNNYSPV